MANSGDYPYLRDFLPNGPIPKDPVRLKAYKDAVKIAGWKYHDGPYAKEFSPDAILYMQQLDEMIEAVASGTPSPLIAQGMAKWYLYNPKGRERLANAVLHIQTYRKNFSLAMVERNLELLIK